MRTKSVEVKIIGDNHLSVQSSAQRIFDQIVKEGVTLRIDEITLLGDFLEQCGADVSHTRAQAIQKQGENE